MSKKQVPEVEAPEEVAPEEVAPEEVAPEVILTHQNEQEVSNMPDPEVVTTEVEFAEKLLEVQRLAERFGVVVKVQTQAQVGNPFRSGSKAGGVYDILAETTLNGGITLEELTTLCIERGIYEVTPNTSMNISMQFPVIAENLGLERSSRELVLGYDKTRKRVLYGIPSVLTE